MKTCTYTYTVGGVKDFPHLASWGRILKFVEFSRFSFTVSISVSSKEWLASSLFCCISSSSNSLWSDPLSSLLSSISLISSSSLKVLVWYSWIKSFFNYDYEKSIHLIYEMLDSVGIPKTSLKKLITCPSNWFKKLMTPLNLDSPSHVPP